MASTTPEPSACARRGGLLDAYYRAFFSDPVLRAWYGDSGYANLGLWNDGVDDAAAAGDALVDALIERVPRGLSGAVLDVACGQGGSTARLSRHTDPARVTAIGSSAEQLTAARRRTPESVFLQMDASRLAFASGSFDVVLCVEAAFHFDTRARFLAEAYRVLKPGGSLVLSDLLMNDGTPLVPEGNHVPGLAAYAELLQRQGFQDVRTEDVTRRTWRAYRRRLTAFICARTERWRSAAGVRDLLTANAGLAWAIRACVLASATKPTPGHG
ncbi:MAG: class I SAM-dependent methyltransferase [Pseudomonadales bacterium]